MTFYILPTTGRANHSTSRPHGIRVLSTNREDLDADGNTCVFVETFCGERFTISKDLLSPEAVAAPFSQRLRMTLYDLVRDGAVVHTLGWERYNAWLDDIRHRREARQKAHTTNTQPTLTKESLK